MVSRILRGLLILTSSCVFTFLVGCGGSSHSSSNGGGSGGGGGGNNVQSIAVNGGPVAGQIYANGAFTSVTVCVPNSSTCQMVDGILVDTGSYGLRILESAIPSLSLPLMTGSGGTTFYNCVSFVDRSFLWGAVAQADLEISGEKASGVSIQLVGDPTGFTVPTACSNGGVDVSNLTRLGANGIIGVGPFPEDCGQACAPSQGGTPPPVYFTCVASGNCQTAFVALAQQIVNPVVRFAADNNGVILEMQSVNVASATATGSMIFGIGTQPNNTLGSANFFPLGSSGFMTTLFNQKTLSESFIDSGSNGYFFPDSAIPQCGQNSNAPGFYCPTNSMNLSAQTVDSNNAQNTVNFTVDNALTDFQSNGSDSAFSNLAGSNGSDTCSGQTPCGFDWGMPFFYGRHVFTSIAGRAVPSGAPAAPWWAY